MSKTLQVLYDEHQSIAAVLDAFSHLLRECERGKPVDPKVFRQILHYLDVIPERYHHPKEDEFLFAPLRLRTPEAEELIARLEHQHARGRQALEQLGQAMAGWDAGGPAARAPFLTAGKSFIARYREHMALEEEQLMPLAEQRLTPEDWATAEAEFAKHHDPLKDARDAKDLYRRILYLAPPPIGLGEPMT